MSATNGTTADIVTFVYATTLSRRSHVFNFPFFASSLEIEFAKTSPDIMLRSGKAFPGLFWEIYMTREGPMPFVSASRLNAASFPIYKRSMLQDALLPLSDVINEQRWQQVFDEYEINFGNGLPLRSPYKARAVYGSCRPPFGVVL